MANKAWVKLPFRQTRRILAKIWRQFFPQITVIGVTGSFGKTNTVQAIASVLKQKGPVLQTDLNLDTLYNLPLTLFKIRPKHRFLVLEYGVDHKGEMSQHLNLIKPQIGVLTGINPTHSEPELLGSIAGIMEEKGKLLQALPKNGWAILNWDGRQVRMMGAKTKAQVIKYGITPKADYTARQIKVNFSGTKFILQAKGEEIAISTGLVGRHFVHACLAAAAVGKILGLSWQEISQGLGQLKPLKGRLSVEKGPLGTVLLNDALRANPASTLAGLETLAALPTQGRRIAVLGEMGELGSLSKQEHQILGQKLATLKIDYFIGAGELQKLTVSSALKAGMNPRRVFWVAEVNQAAQKLKTILRKNDLLYLKGSLLKHLERIILILEGKKVACLASGCHRYQSCLNCPYLHSPMPEI
jgi:UDP-N-acetylmuramoyl-tripeptide--D-alanyl-D-alanine ligase/murE/murF fusion protein